LPPTSPSSRYTAISEADVIWEADARKGRPDNATYRESLDAVYQGPYTKGKRLGWDGLVSNNPGMINADPERGFVLTMPAGQASDAGYTTRDFASAPHGVDYQPHYAEWMRDHTVHPNLVFPGRSVIFRGVRMEALALGDELLGTAGCILQDWVGLDFPTMEKYASDKERYTGGGFLWLPPQSKFGRAAAAVHRFQRRGPFSQPIPGVAPLLVLFSRLKGFMVAGMIWVPPDEPHEFAIHWTRDAGEMELWADGELIMDVRAGSFAIPLGLQTGGRVRFHRSGAHACCWQDNNDGSTEVHGTAGNPDHDQPFTIERVQLVQT
jgi:hypothetical protein